LAWILMHAEIIAIGDEIVSGEHLDTNSSWLSQRLEEFGVRVLYHTTVGDELEACAEVFRRAMERADIVISTGGLGPTADDLTREALARATGRELVLNPQALEHIRSLFARRKWGMPPQNEIQAMFPAGSRMIANPHGTAPGIDLEIPRDLVERKGDSPIFADHRFAAVPAKMRQSPCRFFALPGVPGEMIEMWNATLASEIGALAAGRKVIRRRKINCFGAGESQIEAMLPDMIRRGRTPTVGITASKNMISLRIVAEAHSEEECNALIEPTAATIRNCLGRLVFGEGDEELQHAVMRLLREANKTLVTVEWGTAGLVADWLGDVPEGNECFLGGLVVQNRESMGRLLGLDQNLLVDLPALGEQVSERMAAACRERFGADYGLAVGCFPEIDPRDPKPVHLALADAKGVKVKSILYAGHSDWLRIYIAKYALNMLRLAMLD
jgi:nicotinamide-nucleotide amidase